jgi:hypothetical protein
MILDDRHDSGRSLAREGLRDRAPRVAAHLAGVLAELDWRIAHWHALGSPTGAVPGVATQ